MALFHDGFMPGMASDIIKHIPLPSSKRVSEVKEPRSFMVVNHLHVFVSPTSKLSLAESKLWVPQSQAISWFMMICCL